MADVLERRHPLGGRHAASAGVSISAAPAAARLILRAGAKEASALSRALGLDLPRVPKSAVAGNGGARAALWLGPDEWLVIDEGREANAAALMSTLAGADALHSAVDVSHRNTAILVAGPAAADVLMAGCPQDLSLAAFPVNACSRTVLGRIEVVVWRLAETSFRVECWRSFAPYAFDFLAEAARDAY